MSHSQSHSRGQSSDHDHFNGHDFDPKHPNAFCHILLRRRKNADPDYFIRIVDFIKNTNETWTWELRANDLVLQMTIPCMKELKSAVAPHLHRAMALLDLVRDWVIVETIHNKEATTTDKLNMQMWKISLHPQ
ncbi:hypothetical protein HG530_005715 [Fusarium avenaceum]|nr:hypothetical protein HG530_005715 [Fusarium avenaceum]